MTSRHIPFQYRQTYPKELKAIVGQLPGSVGPDRICLAGLRDCEFPYIKKRVENLGLTHFSPQDLASSSKPVIDWLKGTGASKVMVHFDMDIMDPSDILAAVADGPEGGMKLTEVVRLINEIAAEKELIALTVAEPMPRLAIRLKKRCSPTFPCFEFI